MSKTPDPETTLFLRHDFNAERERVFSAFLDAKILRKIWSTPAYPIVEMSLTPRVDAGWRLTMRDEQSGQLMHCAAQFVEITRPSRIVWRTKWEDGPMSAWPDMRVTLEFDETPRGTTVRLAHEFFPDSTARDHHAGGWGSGFRNLEQLLQGTSRT